MALGGGNRVVLITGPPGIGKTTLVKRVCSELSEETGCKTAGFITEEMREHGSRTGFEVVRIGAQMERATLATAHPGGKQGPSLGKYTVLVEEFEQLALQSLEDSMSADVLILDELGKIESFSRKFVAEVKKILQHPMRPLVLATIPIAKGKSLEIVQAAKNESSDPPISLTRDNRDEMKNTVVELITNSLKLLS